MARYRFAPNGAAYGPPHGLLSTLAKVRSICIRDGGAYKHRAPDKHWSRDYHGKVRFLLVVTRVLRQLAVGSLARVATCCDGPTDLGHEYLIRRVAVRVRQPANVLRYYSGAPVDINDGNPRVAAVATYVAKTFPRAMCSGYRYTRRVAGFSDVWSQHSAWHPMPGYANAIDITVYNDDDPSKGTDMAATRKVALGIVAQAKLGNLTLHRVIFGDQDWRRDHGWSPISYTGEFHTHVHSEGEPSQAGTPVDA